MPKESKEPIRMELINHVENNIMTIQKSPEQKTGCKSQPVLGVKHEQ